ncbi:MAG: acyl carrier protein [Planctomycetaceae bacterium]|nr:acyl carrier protein [Planctomycetaceae bacterium]
MMTVRCRLQEVFRKVFDDPTLQLTDDLSMANFEDWDSVATVQLVLAAEAEFGVRFSMDEVAGIQSAPKFLALIEGCLS